MMSSHEVAEPPRAHVEPGGDSSSPMAGASIPRGTALALVVAFCAFLTLPVIVEWRGAAPSVLPGQIRADIGKYGMQLALNQLEQHLVYDSRFANLVRRPYQRWLISAFGQGSRSVLIGANGFWFHRSEMNMIAGPGILSPAFNLPRVEGRNIVEDAADAAISRLRGRTVPTHVDPPEPATALEVLEDFDRRLKTAGVHLLVVLVPGKLMIYPELLSPRYPAAAGPARNADFEAFAKTLNRRGVDVADLTDPFFAAKSASPALFLRRDTHWSPAGLALGADIVSARVRPFLGDDVARSERASQPIEVPEPMDLLATLGLRGDPRYQGENTVTLSTVSPVPAASTEPHHAPVILFGDSLSGYYDMEHAGLASQLALRLGVDVRSFIGFGATLPGAVNTAFRNDANLLHGVRVVVLETHIRQLFERTFSSRFELGPSR